MGEVGVGGPNVCAQRTVMARRLETLGMRQEHVELVQVRLVTICVCSLSVQQHSILM